MSVVASMPYPHIDEPFTTFMQVFGTPRHTTIVNGYVLRNYLSDLGAITVLFEQGRSIGVRLPYPPAPRRRSAMNALAAEFAPRHHCRFHLLLADRGWLLVTDRCSPGAIDLLATL